VNSQTEENLALQNFREAIAKSQHIIVVAGAGLSAASGLAHQGH
jgi:NAD-dependent SIR2 family protein deacetylase